MIDKVERKWCVHDGQLDKRRVEPIVLQIRTENHKKNVVMICAIDKEKK